MTLLDSKAAIRRAKAYLEEILPGVTDLRFEEIERSPQDHEYWLVTFSFARPDLMILGEPVTNPHRDYKTVTVNSSTGEPVAVKIRELSQ